MATRKPKRSNKTPSVLPGQLMDKVSELFVQSMFYSEKPEYPVLGMNIVMFWQKERDSLLGSKPEFKALAEKFNDALIEAFKAPHSYWCDTVPKAMEPFRGRANQAATLSKIDMMQLWHEVAFNKTQSFDIPWLRSISVSEKFKPFIEAGEEGRYLYKGFTNQALIARAMHGKPGSVPVMLNKTDIVELLAHDFSPDRSKTAKENDDARIRHSYAKLKGVSSDTSIFRPNISKFWVNSNGERHPEYRPKPEMIKRLNLQERSFISSFSSFPVWSASSFKGKFSDEVLARYNELVDIRTPGEKVYFKGERREDLHTLVENEINRVLDDQSLKINVGGDRASYFPQQDEIEIPEHRMFTNPVEWYSTVMHEISHSTKHLLGRPASSLGDKFAYASEELVAESTAYILTKNLQREIEDLHDGNMPEEWKNCFDEYYENSVSYNQGWGKPVSFKDLFVDMINDVAPSEKENGKLERLMGAVIDSTLLMKSGMCQGKKITPELRNEKLEENFAKLKNDGHQPLIDRGNQNTRPKAG